MATIVWPERLTNQRCPVGGRGVDSIKGSSISHERRQRAAALCVPPSGAFKYKSVKTRISRLDTSESRILTSTCAKAAQSPLRHSTSLQWTSKSGSPARSPCQFGNSPINIARGVGSPSGTNNRRAARRSPSSSNRTAQRTFNARSVSACDSSKRRSSNAGEAATRNAKTKFRHSLP